MDSPFGPLDPSVFYRDFAAASPLGSAARHLSALATRLCYSVLFAMLAMPESLWLQVQQLLTPSTLWGLCLVVAAWLLATVIGGPVGAALDALIIAYGLYELWPVVKSVAGDLWQWAKGAYYARTEQELSDAGRHFADALAAGSLAVIESIVLHRVFQRVSAKLSEHWPPPKWLEQRVGEVKTKRSRATEETKRAKEKSAQKSVEKQLSSGAARLLTPAGKGVGELPVAFAVGTAAVAVVGLAAVAVWVSAQKDRK